MENGDRQVTPAYKKEDLLYLKDLFDKAEFPDPHMSEYTVEDRIRKILFHPKVSQIRDSFYKEKALLDDGRMPTSHHILEVLEEVFFAPLDKLPIYMNPFPEDFGVKRILERGKIAVDVVIQWRLKIAK